MSTRGQEENDAVVVEDLDIAFGHIHILEGLSTTVERGRSVGLVGESGSGKSTLGKAIVGINPARGGRIDVFGQDITGASRRQRRALSRIVQYIPQDPYSSLSPRRTIAQTLAEALDPRRTRTVGSRERERVLQTLEAVGLDEQVLPKYPHEFSGGQRQRIAIARALLLEPRLIIADEITSALDVSVQSEIIALLRRLRESLSLTMIFISHSLAVVEQVCDDVIVMQQGQIREQGPIREVFRAPRSTYTRSLLASVPGAPGFTLS